MWVVVGLPVAFLGAFMLLPMVGVTINIMSLFAFILVLGIVVDDAIIVAESAHAETERTWLQPEKHCHRHKESGIAGNLWCPHHGGCVLAAVVSYRRALSNDSRSRLCGDILLIVFVG